MIYEHIDCSIRMVHLLAQALWQAAGPGVLYRPSAHAAQPK